MSRPQQYAPTKLSLSFLYFLSTISAVSGTADQLQTTRSFKEDSKEKTMVVAQTEEDFPRGGAHIVPSTEEAKGIKRKVDDDDRLFGDGTKKRKDSTGKVKSQKSKKVVKAKPESQHFVKPITTEILTEGVMGIGVVLEIAEDKVVLETADCCKVTLPATNISKKFTQLLKEDKISLSQVFEIGQMVPFYVVKAYSKDEVKGVTPTTVSCDPSKLNSHLTPARLLAGLSIHAIVESIEEKGAVLDIGLQSLQGFLPKEKQPPKGIVVGEPIIVRIESHTSRIVKVSAFVEQDHLSHESCENLQMNHLMPGTVVECSPTEHEATGNGVIVTLGNGVNVAIRKKHLPPRLRSDLSRFVKPVRGVIMLCKQNSNLVVISAHPDVVAVTKPEKRREFQNIAIGETLACKIIDVHASTGNVTFSLPISDDGKAPLITAISKKELLHMAEDIETTYTIGSEHKCRVVDTRMTDRTIVVATRKDILKQKIVSHKEAAPGELLNAKVTSLGETGAHLLIEGMVKGFLPKNHTTDGTVSLEKAFPVDKEFKCRALYFNDSRKQIIVTARPSLVNYKGLKITEFDESYTGKLSLGVIVKVLPSNAALVAFYNSVKGFLPATLGKALGKNLKLNKTIEVRIASVDPIEKKISLVLPDEAAVKSAGAQRPEVMRFAAPGRQLYKAEVDSVKALNVVGKRVEQASVSITTAKGKSTAILNSNMISDCIDPPFQTIVDVIKEGNHLADVVPLGSQSGADRILCKGFVSEWVKNTSNIVPKTFEDLTNNQIVCAVIIQKKESLYFAEIVGGSGLSGTLFHVPKESDDSSTLQVGQTILGKVCNIKADEKTFGLNVQIKDCIPQGVNPSDLAVSLVRSSVQEMVWLCSLYDGLPSIGESVTATVSNVIDGTTYVTCKGGFTGFIKKENMSESKKKGQKIECTVLDYTFPDKNAELMFLPPQDDDDPARVVLSKRDYIAIWDSSLCFVPNRFHPNHVPSSKKGRLELGAEVELNSFDDVNDTLSVGLLEDDVQLIKNFVTKGVASASKDKSSRNLKLGKVVTATVAGPWKMEIAGRLAVEIKMPDNNIGRLHLSEFPTAFVDSNPSTDLLAKFVSEYQGKAVNVKVIGFTDAKKDGEQIHIAEVSMVESKVTLNKIKAKLLGYKGKFQKGDSVRCYVVSVDDSQNIKVEVNPSTFGVIPKATLKQGTTLVNHEVVSCVVTEQNKGKHSINHLVLRTMDGVEQDASSLEFKFGQKVTGKVINVDNSTLNVKVLLSSNRVATLCPTAVSDNYNRVRQHVTKFKKGVSFQLHAIRMESVNIGKKGTNKNFYVMTEKRYKDYVELGEDAEQQETSLIVDPAKLNDLVGKTMLGFVRNKDKNSIFVEIGPGIVGRIRNPAAMTHNSVGSVVHVSLIQLDNAGRPCLAYKPRKQEKSDRKRTTSEMKSDEDEDEDEQEEDEEEVPKKIMKVEKDEEEATTGGVKAVMEDPGFDFSNTGFRPEDLAEIGKIGTESVETTKKNTKEAKVDKKTPKKLKAKANETDLEKELRLSSYEAAAAVGIEPETEEDFSLLLMKEPNSAEVWIRYITFFLAKNDLAKARATAERALTSIHYREEQEILNVWTAYLNMEVVYGELDTAKAVFERACGNADSLKIHKQMAQIYARNKKNDLADQIFNVMIKKFRASSDDVWVMYAEHLMSTDRIQEGRDLLQRALSSVPKPRHNLLITRFAQLEYRKGDAERGKTLFESLVTAYPKKTDTWIVYGDLVLKQSGIEEARQIMERASSLSLSTHKLRPILKRWLEMENSHGDEQSQQLVRSKAEKCAKSLLEDEE